MPLIMSIKPIDEIKRELALIVHKMDTIDQCEIGEIYGLSRDVTNAVFHIYDLLASDSRYTAEQIMREAAQH